MIRTVPYRFLYAVMYENTVNKETKNGTTGNISCWFFLHRKVNMFQILIS